MPQTTWRTETLCGQGPHHPERSGGQPPEACGKASRRSRRFCPWHELPVACQ